MKKRIASRATVLPASGKEAGFVAKRDNQADGVLVSAGVSSPAFPLILSNLTQPLLSTVDTVLSGHLPGAAALGGVAVGGIFFNTIYWTFGFLRMGTTGLVAQAHGAEQYDQLRLHFLRALFSAVAIGALILAAQGPLIAVTIRLLGASDAVAANARLYSHIRIWSAPAALTNFVILGYLLGRQRARTALALQAAINVVNVCMALFLVLRLHWGVAGIAIATASAEWVGCLLGLVLARDAARHPDKHPLSRGELLHGPGLRRLFALNRDLLLRTLSLVAAYAWFTRAGAREGDSVLAANAVLMNMNYIAAYGLDGFANATEALVGESIGARRLNDYRAVLKASAVWAFLVAGAGSLMYLVAGPWLVGVFTHVEAVRVLGCAICPGQFRCPSSRWRDFNWTASLSAPRVYANCATACWFRFWCFWAWPLAWSGSLATTDCGSRS